MTGFFICPSIFFFFYLHLMSFIVKDSISNSINTNVSLSFKLGLGFYPQPFITYYCLLILPLVSLALWRHHVPRTQ